MSIDRILLVRDENPRSNKIVETLTAAALPLKVAKGATNGIQLVSKHPYGLIIIEDALNPTNGRQVIDKRLTNIIGNELDLKLFYAMRVIQTIRGAESPNRQTPFLVYSWSPGASSHLFDPLDITPVNIRDSRKHGLASQARELYENHKKHYPFLLLEALRIQGEVAKLVSGFYQIPLGELTADSNIGRLSPTDFRQLVAGLRTIIGPGGDYSQELRSAVTCREVMNWALNASDFKNLAGSLKKFVGPADFYDFSYQRKAANINTEAK